MESPYITYNDRIGVRLSFILKDEEKKNIEEGKERKTPEVHPDSFGWKSYSAYQKECGRKKDFRLKEGKGKGNEALINWEAMPIDWQEAFKIKFGDPKQQKNPLEKYYKVDGEAKTYYDNFQFEDGSFLKPEQKDRYKINASVLNALIELKKARETSRKMRGGSMKNLWSSLINDCKLFNEYLKNTYGYEHTLPSSEKLKVRFKEYVESSYSSLIDGRNKNSNSKVVTVEMLTLWKEIYAGQRGYKPNHEEVHNKYKLFLAGKLQIINNQTGEEYDYKNTDSYRHVTDKTVFNHQNMWENRVVTHSIRSGDRQKYKSLYQPYHKLLQPESAGSIISIDDRQPPFEYAKGKRMWFYNAIDLGSEAFTCWVYGDSKEGIITEFYKQLVRNYNSWGMNMPYELECESSLNSSFKDTFLENGAMFQEVRIEANNARGKRIEAYYRQIRYDEKKHLGWLARPFALDEANQKSDIPVPLIPKEQIIKRCLKDIWEWNNSLHSNQKLHPGMTRWDVFMDKQHPELTPTNWAGILPHLGIKQESSMKAGRITLQRKHRVVGFDGKVATGETLINIMKKIEGEKVNCYWLDDNEGEVMKTLVYDTEGKLICELLGDLAYNRSKLETTEKDKENRSLMSAYENTVNGFVQVNARKIDSVTLIETDTKPVSNRFVMPGLDILEISEEKETIELPQIEEEEDYLNSVSSSLKNDWTSHF